MDTINFIEESPTLYNSNLACAKVISMVSDVKVDERIVISLVDLSKVCDSSIPAHVTSYDYTHDEEGNAESFVLDFGFSSHLGEFHHDGLDTFKVYSNEPFDDGNDSNQHFRYEHFYDNYLHLVTNTLF